MDLGIIDFGDAYARKPDPRDIDQIYAYRNDPAVYQMLGGHFTGMSREDVSRWIEHHRTNTGDLVWAIASKDSDECIGHCGLYKIDYRRGKAELGTAIARSHWGGGLGGRVLAGLIEFGFRRLRLHRLETFNLETNKKIVRVKEHLGFKLEGILRDYEYRDGQFINVMAMAVLATEWNGIPEKYRWPPPSA